MADKKFTLQFDFEGNITPIKTAVENFKKTLKEVKLPDNLSTSIEKTLSKLNSEMESFEALTKMDFNNLGDISKAEKSFGKIITLLNQLEIQSKSITGLDAKKFLPQTTIDRVKKLEKAWEDLEKETNKKDELSKKIKAQTEAIEEQRAALKKLEDEREALANINKAKGARKGQLVSSQNADKKRREEVVTEMTALESEKGGKSSARYTALKQELSSLGQAINNADREIDALSKDIAKNQVKINSYKSNIEGATNSLQQMEKELIDLQNSNIAPKGLNELRQELAQLKNVQIDQIPVDLKELQQTINSLTDDELKEISVSLEEIKKSANNLPESAHKGAEGIQDLVESGRNAAQAADEIQNLKNQVLQFFSITNAIQLFKRTVQSALETVKELDAVMTETAVVTDFTVGDMWEKLPEYSAEATKLGASIRDLYGATTLYYQQGLQTEEAMSVGIETMKMARIADMEAADATEAMTAALRGFNMEVNETNAVRVNDVYSELAAITAADTNQIATAMGKTASIAASANMEFETTAALLAQIIETTQEAPETAGTAMKTIIARFTEVKELFSEGMLTGEDSEGEEININKIDAALKTVGISLKDFLNGQKGIDDIFLELASKWDDLDLATQRYIATMAAGSRQQSRFIAMMSNYDRTMELVTAANNSAGASQEQFDKTLESMEAKLQKLKNAWDEFAMGLANNEILKGAVDVLTGILTTVNSLTEALSGGNGLAKSIISLITVIGALKGGGGLFHKALGGIGEGLGISKEEGTGKKKTMTDGKGSDKQSRAQGEKDGKAYVSGWNRAIEQGKKGGFKEGLKGFFGEESEVVVPIELDKTDYLAQIYDLNQEKLNFDIGEVALAFDKGGIEAANEAVKQMNGQLIQTGSTVKTFNVDLQSVGQSITMLGGAVGLLSSLFDSLGLEEAAEATNVLATVFMGLGSVISVLTSVIPGLGSAFQIVGGKIVVAGVTSQLAWWWVFIIIGAIAALTIGVYALAKAAQANSLEGRMEAAAEATEKAKTAAEEAKTAYDELLNTKNTYSELQTTLENLTQGTKEWKQALLDANSQVLSLLETYPQLAQYLSRGEDGQLTITDTGWEQLEQQRYDQMVNAQAMQYGSQIVELDLEKEQAEGQLDSAIDWKFVDGSSGYIDYERAEKAQDEIMSTYEEMPEIFSEISQISAEEFLSKSEEEQAQIWNNSNLARQFGDYLSLDEGMINTSSDAGVLSYDVEQLIQNNGLQKFSDELYDLANSTGFTAEELYNMRNSVADYDSFLKSYTQQIETYAQAFMAGIDENAAKSDYANEVTQGVAKNFAQVSADEISKETQNLKGDKNQEAQIKALATELRDERGYAITDTTGSLKTYQEVYKALTGQEAEDMTMDELAEAIAKVQVSEDYSDKAEVLISKLDALAKVDERQANIVSAMISRDSSGLNISEMKEMETTSIYDQAKKLGYEDLSEYATAQGYQDKKISKLNQADQLAAAEQYMEQLPGKFESADEALEYMKNNDITVTAGLQLYIDDEQFKAELEAQRADIISGIDSVMGEGYTESSTQLSTVATQVLKNLSDQVSFMGEEDAKAYISKFEGVLNSSNLTQEQNEQLANYLSNVDWSNMTEAVNAMDYMQSMGIDPSTIQSFWDTATDGANTYISSLSEALSLTERMQKKMQSVDDIESALSEGTASYDQMMEMVNAGVDISNFQLTPEGWSATAEEIENATDKLREYNAEQARATAEQQKEQSQKAQDIWENAGETAQLKQLTTQNEDGTLVGGKIEELSQARGIAFSLGEQAYNAKNESEEEFLARIQTAYDSYINLLNNDEDTQIILEKQAAMAEAARYTTDENAAREGATDESVRYSMQQEATDNDLDPQEVTKYADALRVAYSLEQQMADRIAIDNAKMNQGIKELADNWDAWGKVLNSENKGTLEYSTTLTNVRNTMKKLLNINKDLSEDFLTNEENLKLMKKASEGNAEAIKTLRKEATKDIIVQMDLDPDATEQVTSAVNSILDSTEYDDLQIGASLETTSFYSALQGLLDAGAVTTEQMNNILEGIGFEPTVEMETITVQSINSADQTAQVLGPNGEVRTVKLSNDMTVGGTIQVPRIGNSKFKGAPKATINPGNKPSGGGGGGSKEKWENPYDEFYNVVEDINEELRTREKLERRYQALLDKTGTKASDLVKNARDQINSLEKQKKLREGLLEGRTRQMSDIESEYSDLSKYAWYNEQDGTIEIDWEKINALDGSTNEKLTSRIEEYIGKLEEQQDLIEQEEDELEAIEETLREIRDQGKDEYFDFEEQIKEALIDQRQKEIDKLNAINDSINDTNSRLIDAMQSSIDKYRQDRENEKTEEELADKQRRLAYLQQDTSGANALDIMQLQEEIDQGMEDYTDQLIDQKISELQQQNDEAAEQRQQQIDIMNDQLQHDIATGAIWDKVYELMGSGIDEDGIKVGSSLWELLKDQQDYPSKSNLEKLDWAESLRDLAAQAVQWLSVGNSTEALIASGDLQKGQKITFKTADGKTVEGKLQDNGDIIADSKTYKDVRRNYDGSFVTEENYQDKETEIATTTSTPTSTTNTNSTKTNKQTNKGKSKVNKFSFNGANYSSKTAALEAINKWETDQISWEKIRWFQGQGGHSESYLDSRLKTIRTQANSYRNKLNFHKFKTGGLADFTGPAWLDGTKSKPEYILNSDQTKAFFELVDVLSGLKGGVNTSSQITGDSIYDVDINVESIGSDYDVEQLAQTVKRMINDDARYRNNNAINLSR